jgi:3-oxoacyl-[acyl-carrier protein] reductase
MDRRCALVTGASRGIGRGIAEALAVAGLDVAINYVRSVGAARDVAERARAAGVRGEVFQADVAAREDRARLLGAVRDAFGRLDVLVNNAGVSVRQRVDMLEATEESFDEVMGINLKGPYFLAQHAARWMIEQRASHPDRSFLIINIASISSYTSSPPRGEYCVAKAGMSMMTKLFADRLGDEGILVYELRPGIVATDMTAGVKEKYDRLIAEGLTPIRRWGQPADVGRAVMSLVRGDFPFSTGEVINVDGGFHLRRL